MMLIRRAARAMLRLELLDEKAAKGNWTDHDSRTFGGLNNAVRLLMREIAAQSTVCWSAEGRPCRRGRTSCPTRPPRFRERDVSYEPAERPKSAPGLLPLMRAAPGGPRVFLRAWARAAGLGRPFCPWQVEMTPADPETAVLSALRRAWGEETARERAGHALTNQLANAQSAEHPLKAAAIELSRAVCSTANRYGSEAGTESQ